MIVAIGWREEKHWYGTVPLATRDAQMSGQRRVGKGARRERRINKTDDSMIRFNEEKWAFEREKNERRGHYGKSEL